MLGSLNYRWDLVNLLYYHTYNRLEQVWTTEGSIMDMYFQRFGVRTEPLPTRSIPPTEIHLILVLDTWLYLRG